MVVDKFGRSRGGGGSDGKSSGQRGPKGEGFVLDNSGNYLVSFKQIKQLDDPEDERDAVNKRWLDSRIKPIEDQLRAYAKDRTDLFYSASNGVITGEKALETSQAVKNSVEGLTTQVAAINERESVIDSTLKEHTNRIEDLERNLETSSLGKN